MHKGCLRRMLDIRVNKYISHGGKQTGKGFKHERGTEPEQFLICGQVDFTMVKYIKIYSCGQCEYFGVFPGKPIIVHRVTVINRDRDTMICIISVGLFRVGKSRTGI